MDFDSAEVQALWRRTSLLLYQAGDVQSLIQEGASQSEIRKSLEKTARLAHEALTLLNLCPLSVKEAGPIKAVVALPLEADQGPDLAA